MIEIKPDSVIFKRWPMSVSSNQLYASVNGRLIKSDAGRNYSLQVHAWAQKNKSTIDKLKAILRGKTLRVDCAFFFPKSKLVTKKNTLKRIDWSNRIKLVHDNLADLIEVDDSHFISGYCCKKISDNDESYVDITISESNLER